MTKTVGINVVARFRPVGDESQHLINQKDVNFRILEAKSVGMKNRKGTDLMFHLDTVLSDQTTQEEMFEAVGDPITRDVLNGYNGTVFVYGQTGSGKTHSLFGDMSARDAPQRGIIPRSCHRIFEHFQSAEDVQEVVIQMSFVEIYLEKLQDLLEPKNNGTLKIRQRVDHSIFIEGLHQEFVSSFDDVYDLMQIGFRNRVVASTKMNSESSRSHCVLILNIKQTLKGGTVKRSKINFADLAGSEKVKKTGATAELLEQAKAINKSLSALGNVIAALTSKEKGVHIPYRTSKLTHLLKDALGGNTKTTLVIACSSDIYNSEETVGTLRFASRAKQITNKVTANKQMSVKEMQLMIEVLKKKVGDGQATIQELLAFLEEMQSENLENANGPKIQDFMARLAVHKHSGKRKKQKKGNSTSEPFGEFEQEDLDEKEHEDDAKVERGDSMVSSLSEEEKRERLSAANYELSYQMELLRTELNARDNVVDDLNQEVLRLKRQSITQRARAKFMQVVEKTMEQKARPSLFQSESISIRDRTALIDRLNEENEALKQDKVRLSKWNEELKSGLDFQAKKMRKHKLVQPIVRRAQLLRSRIAAREIVKADTDRLQSQNQSLDAEREALNVESDRLKTESLKLEEQRIAAQEKIKTETDALETQRRKVNEEMESEARRLKAESLKIEERRLAAEKTIKMQSERLDLERQKLEEAVETLQVATDHLKMEALKFEEERLAAKEVSEMEIDRIESEHQKLDQAVAKLGEALSESKWRKSADLDHLRAQSTMWEQRIYAAENKTPTCGCSIQ